MLVAAPLGSGKHGPRYDLDNDTYVAAYDARGNGDGASASLTGDHGSRVTDYTSLVAFDYCAQGSERTRICCSGEYAQMIAGRPDAIAFDRTRGTSSGDITGPLRKCGAATEGVNDAKADTQCVAYGVSENQRAELRLTPYSRQITSGGGKPDQGYPCVAFQQDATDKFSEGIAPTMRGKSNGGTRAYGVAGAGYVRRLTCRECEDLQGFPPGWTAVLGERATRIDDETIQYLRCQYCRAYGVVLSDEEVKLIQSDSARYKQLGNAVCVNVIEWIGRRLKAVAGRFKVELLDKAT